MLEDPKRDEYQKPNEILTAPALNPGETIADIGSGSGYLTLRFAACVGDSGHVFAVDIDPDMIRCLNRRLRDAMVRARTDSRSSSLGRRGSDRTRRTTRHP